MTLAWPQFRSRLTLGLDETSIGLAHFADACAGDGRAPIPHFHVPHVDQRPEIVLAGWAKCETVPLDVSKDSAQSDRVIEA